jgi:4-hydroxybenzoate polyprenyltransferase
VAINAFLRPCTFNQPRFIEFFAYGQHMRLLLGLGKACHPLPTVVVSLVITAFAWSLGWSGRSLAFVFITIFVGQLSVGWSNDAHDASLDSKVGRVSKPVVAQEVSVRTLWVAAITALFMSIVLSWLVAGWVGGSFHVLALVMAWLYNLRLSRTAWSWLPYAVAFGSAPAFLTYGLNGEPPTFWSVAMFAIIGVSAHLANALPDAEIDASADMGGAVVSLGPRRSLLLCWLLLAVGGGILFVVSFGAHTWLAAAVSVVFILAVIVGSVSHRREAMFYAVIGVVVVDVATLVAVTAITH